MRSSPAARPSRSAPSRRRAWIICSVLAGSAALVPVGALAAGEAGSPVTAGTGVLGVAAESSGSVIGVGSAGASMLVQRFSSTGAASGAPFPAGAGVARAAVVQSDGKIVVAGSDNGMVVRRFNADGSLDTGFGSSGTARAAATTANSVAIGPCGTIVAGGSAPGGEGASRIALARWTANGSPDPSLAGSGRAVIDLGAGSQAKDIAVQADGKIVFAGEQVPGGNVVNALIGRATTGGGLDPGFNGGGPFFYYHPQGGGNSTFNSVAIDAAGKIVAVGADRQDIDSHALFVRLTTAGTPDASFGSGGILSPSASSSYNGGEPVGPRAVEIAGGNRIVAAGAVQSSGQRSAALWALTPAGQLDPALGSGGVTSTTNPGPDGAEARALAVTPSGDLFAGGNGIAFAGSSQGYVTRYNGFGAPPAIAGPTCGSPPPPPPPVTTPTTPTTTPKPPTQAARFASVSLSPLTIGPRTRALLRFTLSRAARVRLTVEAQRSGRRQGRSCRAPSSRNTRGRRCIYYSRVASLTVTGKAGVNRFTITRRFAGKTLALGSYRLVLLATGGATRRISFKVVG